MNCAGIVAQAGPVDSPPEVGLDGVDPTPAYPLL